MSAVQGKSPLMQVKEPYCNSDIVTCRLFDPAKLSVQSTPGDDAREGVRQYLKKELCI